MLYTIIYKNFTVNQKKQIIDFIKSNFTDSCNIELDKNTIVIINVINKQIIGCVCLLTNEILKTKINNKTISVYYNIETNKKGLFLYNFCVDINQRNKGLGNNLIKTCIDFIKSYDIDYLHCQIENNISKHICLNNNFIINDDFININNEKIYKMSFYK